MIFSCNQSIPANSSLYEPYDGTDLGLSRSDDTWIFKVWSPPADKMRVIFYETGDIANSAGSMEMKREENGTWTLGMKAPPASYYAFQARIDGKWMDEVVDPYVKVVGINGQRGYLALPSAGNPDNWAEDRRLTVQRKTDIIIYELHVRDLSMDSSSGITYKGKFLGFTEKGSTTAAGVSTGLDHLKELRITHVHLLPSFDFRSIDEAKLEKEIFNWGYDPLNYNVPEGSFSTDPYDPLARIREFKSLVMALHGAGIGVILDVVYNHTGHTEASLFNQLVPGYYYRQWEDGAFSDASACGNETASEKHMMRKFMIESFKYWAEEYHLDGFRVDLMGIHDIETMNLITETLRLVDPSIFVYGEGWTAGASPLADSTRALKANTAHLDNISVFSDELRDGIKGHWNEKKDRGFVSGKEGTKESVKFGIVGAVAHPQISYDQVNYSTEPWAREPWQMISYVSCHDDLTLWDKLALSNPGSSRGNLVQMHKLANTIVMTAQGVPFLHGGVDFLRSKGGDHNSFESPDSINSIKWYKKEKHLAVHRYYQGLIELRKAHPAFKMVSAQMVRDHLKFLEVDDPLVIGYMLRDHANGDPWQTILVYFNGGAEEKMVELPEGAWHAVVQEGMISLDGLNMHKGGPVSLAGRSALILHD